MIYLQTFFSIRCLQLVHDILHFCSLHFIYATLHSTLYTSAIYILSTLHYTLHFTVMSSLYRTADTLSPLHSTLSTLQYCLHSSLSTLLYCLHSSLSTLQSSLSTLQYCLHSTVLSNLYSTVYTL